MTPRGEGIDFEAELDLWQVSLRAERKSNATVKSYSTGVRAFLDYCMRVGVSPALDKHTVSAFTADLLDQGLEPSTATSRQLAVRRFTAWLTAEEVIDRDDLVGLKSPKLDQKVVEPLTDDQVRALVRACKGKDLRDKRDEAVVRLMVEAGLRAGECAELKLADLDLKAGTVVVRRGKGGKGRVVPFSAQTGQAIGRYLRTRRTHRLASSEALWLGDRGKEFHYDGLHKALRERARAAGITRFHPHLLRHTAAHRWLAAGGSEQGLMTVAGWSTPDMLQRYTKARAADRAVKEARALNLGEL